MPFTPEQKRRLMRAYAPVLFLHRGERFVPISPTAYLERAALWDDNSPGAHLRENWGRPTDGRRRWTHFPRAPLLRPGQLTVNPFAAGGDVHFLGEQVDGAFPFTQSDGERALFLDFRGWWEDGALPELGNEPGKVQETTQNRWAFVERLAQSWATLAARRSSRSDSARRRHDGAVQAPIVSRCSRLAEPGGRGQSGGSRSDIDAEQDRESCRQHESLVHLLSFLLPRP